MKTTKTITINKKILGVFLLSFIAGFLLLFSLEHLGKFSYLPKNNSNLIQSSNKNNYPISTPIASIYYETYFGERVRTSGNGFRIKDVIFKESEFKNYSNRLYYYIEATKTDYKFGLIFSTVLFAIMLFFINFKIKFK
ncbi:hypothetical protein [Mesonia maritima]|uniref:DUF3592 domain-containing protein n=1 Tax=Mesonia maritima TaxID=1793873 RepID=A0ABU1K4H1_9FLAO|nr:hypothetical protein [Mesonia maritima]MDR6300496.1 hypothetical protein [Mesonia maritima]